MDDKGDGSAIAAVLQSDHLIQAIQHELNTVYPGKVIPKNTIRRILYTVLLRQNLLGETRPINKQNILLRQNTTGQLPIDLEESVYDVLMHDKIYSALGG